MKHVLKWRNKYYLVTTGEYIGIIKSKISEFEKKTLPYQEATAKDMADYIESQKKSKVLKGEL